MNIRKGSIDEILELLYQLPEFDNVYPKEEFVKRLSSNALILVAEIDNKIVGVKCGYEMNAKTFYSWMGGVLPNFRNQKVATHLLLEMEKWCLKNSYSALRFKTLNRHKGMLIFALNNGFEIVEATKSSMETKIYLEKKLKKDVQI